MSITNSSLPLEFRKQLWSENQRLARKVVAEYCLREDLKEDAVQEVQLALWEASQAWDDAQQETFAHYAWLVMRRKLLVFLTCKATDRPRLSRKEQEAMNAIRSNLACGMMISSKVIDLLSQESGISRFRLSQLVSFWYSSHMLITASSMIQMEESQDADDRADNAEALDHLDACIQCLPEREQEIIRARFLSDPKMTLAQLSAVLGVSIERVRQLESNAIKKLRTSLSSIYSDGMP